MTLPVFERLLEALRRHGVADLGLFYIGESFLCGWLPDAIRMAKAAGFPRVFVTTNGIQATPPRVRECIVAGLDSLKFALNWADAAQFRELSGGTPATHSTILSNIRGACGIRNEVERTTGHRCDLSASTLLHDEQQRERMEPLLRRIRPFVDEHYWLPLYGADGRDDGGAPRRKPLPCGGIFNELHVTHDGRVSACSLDASPRFHMADVASGSLRNAWHSARFKALREAHLAGDVAGTVCADCIAYKETPCP